MKSQLSTSIWSMEFDLYFVHISDSEKDLEVNYDNEFKLQLNDSRFEAVNGTKIECLGSIIIPVLFYGEERNYRTKLMFYVIRGLGLAGLLGIDELHN